MSGFQPYSRPAFSLLELLIVLVISGVIVSLSTASLRSLRQNAHVRGGMDSYIAKYALTRATAVRMGGTAELHADTAGQRLWIEVRGTSTARDTVGEMTYFEDGVRFRTDRAIICFDARGMARPAGAVCQWPDATVVFSHSGRSDTLRTTVLGRVLR